MTYKQFTIWLGLMFITAAFLTWLVINITITSFPNCQEDEVIYYDDYPNGNPICLHMENFK